ncbi:MAG: Peptidyl-tRNA hydrolase ArfB [Gemmatimonadaceae bacterium]|nr:Peptidyl-tRNA hydrolase ArfB [Gemmatimonadaceae bacterium]
MQPDDIVIDGEVIIPAHEIVLRTSRSGGAGGQHVNTSSTRVELLWNPATSAALTDAQRQLLRDRLARRIDAAGFLRVVSSETRSQAQNRERARARLAELIRSALVRPKVRRATRPSRAAKEQRLVDKRQRAEKKSGRRRPDVD